MEFNSHDDIDETFGITEADPGRPPLIWKGQVDVLEFNLDQVTAIASQARSEVFWAFGSETPMSAQEIAKEIGKSAQTVRYHINELVRVGLLMPVEHRKRRSRIEEAYVHPARGLYFKSQPGLSEEYVQQMDRGFQAMARFMGQERDAIVRLRNIDFDYNVFQVFVTYTVRFKPEKAARVKQMLLELLDDAEEMGEDDGLRTKVAVYMSLSLGESTKILKERGRSKRRQAKTREPKQP